MDHTNRSINILIGDKPLPIVLEEQDALIKQIRQEYTLLKREYDLLQNSYNSLERERSELRIRVDNLSQQLSIQQSQIIELTNRGLFDLLLKRPTSKTNITETNIKIDPE